MTGDTPSGLDAASLKRMPYQFPQPAHSLKDVVVPHAIPLDDRVWVPQAENVWFRRCCSTSPPAIG